MANTLPYIALMHLFHTFIDRYDILVFVARGQVGEKVQTIGDPTNVKAGFSVGWMRAPRTPYRASPGRESSDPSTMPWDQRRTNIFTVVGRKEESMAERR